MYKVVQLSSVHHSRDTRIFHKICYSLVKNGFEVDLIIQNESNEEVDGINVIALPISRKKSDRIVKIIPKLFFKCLRYNKKTIFHFHDPELIPIGILLKILGYKVIHDVHEDVPKDIMTKNWLPKHGRKILAKIYLLIEQMGAKMFDRIITVVPSIARRFDENKIIEIRNYPILLAKSSVKYEIGKDYKYIVYVGSLTTRRGIDILVEAIGLVKSENVKLIIAGNFEEAGLREKLESMKGWQRTNYIGRVNQSELAALLNSAIAGMVVLRGVPSYLDSLPVKMFEYMNAGIPVISSNFPFWDSIIQATGAGITVDENNVTEIANAIDWMVNHPEEANRMGEDGRKAVIKEYNWGVEEKKLVKIYHDLSSS